MDGITEFKFKLEITLILMKALTLIPKVLTKIEDLNQGHSVQYAFEEYKRNVRIFVENMKEEVSSLIDAYEHTIAELRRENERLKGNSPSKQFTRTKPSTFFSTQNTTPNLTRKNKQIGTLLSTMNTAKSNVFTSARDRSLQQLRLSPIFHKISLDHTNPEGSSFQRQPALFQLRNKRKKHREQQLRHVLQCGNKSMNFTTQKFIEAIGGKDKRQNQQNQPIIILNLQEKSFQQDDQSIMNKSLHNICNSLDTSYISKRARKEKRQKHQQIQNELEMKKKNEIITSEMMKKRTIKSLLSHLRENVESSSYQKKETITTSRFFVHHKEEQTHQNPSVLKRSSKVMINPVPIDIEKKSKVTRKENGSSPSQIKPHSILKQSTVLTRSISGFSAIQFDL